MNLSGISIKNLPKLFIFIDKRTYFLEKILRSTKDIVQKKICYLDCTSDKKVNKNGEKMGFNPKYCSQDHSNDC
jgi:hypothetical protein